ncbi:hypothetical protein ACFWFU_05950 [Streptomyces sp. NPDC060235]|uniref:hypothetical protein n=1 Tax=unclassified Streptomyces TaxID=2593676 RepID=UPI00364A3715
MFTIIRSRQEQEVGTTASRQLRRASDFIAAAHYMVRHHPKAGPTTLRLATVFAARMHRSRHGHFAFSIAATVKEIGLSRRTVLTHARYLRELGLIAWVEHGSQRNVLRTRAHGSWAPGDGYRGTATIYAPVAPPLWDQAQGYLIRGTGYRARLVGVTEKGRRRAIAAARSRPRRVRSQPRRCTPSVVVTSAPSHLQVVTGDKKNTRRALKLRRPGSTSTAPAFTASDCQQAIALTEQVQREIWWLYGACSRRVAYALRPLLAAGWTAAQLAAELAAWGVPSHLRDPAAFVHHELTRRRQRAELLPLEPCEAAGPAADDGTRYEAMLRARAQQTPAWQRYTRQLRLALRSELGRRRRNSRAESLTGLAQYRPVLREDEEAFLSSLSVDTWEDSPSPRQIYAARAEGRAPRRGQLLPSPDTEWLRHLREHAEAARACDALRAQWESEQASEAS